MKLKFVFIAVCIVLAMWGTRHKVLSSGGPGAYQYALVMNRWTGASFIVTTTGTISQAEFGRRLAKARE